ncbi:hypothetical protein Tco_0205379 [Tanacetum coccineum]
MISRSERLQEVQIPLALLALLNHIQITTIEATKPQNRMHKHTCNSSSTRPMYVYADTKAKRSPNQLLLKLKFVSEHVDWLEDTDEEVDEHELEAHNVSRQRFRIADERAALANLIAI